MISPDGATRYGNAVLSYVHYLESFAWPARLAPLYPYPRAGIPGAAARGSHDRPDPRHRHRAGQEAAPTVLAMAWFWFLGALVPVIGIVQTGNLARATATPISP